MQIYRFSSLAQLATFAFKNIDTIAIGSFTLIHTGHMQIIQQLQKTKKKNALIVLIQTRKHNQSISELSFKIHLEKMINTLIFVTMKNEDFSITKTKFLQILKVTFPELTTIVHGEHWKFGYMRMGNKKTIIEYGLKSIEVPLKLENGHSKISSSILFKKILSKDTFNEAISDIITKPSFLNPVQKGLGRGRQLGFPTANLVYKNSCLQLDRGIYFTKTYVFSDKRLYNSITNIGYSSTINKKNKIIKHETHIFNFDKDIYGENIEVFYYFLHNIEKVHKSKAELCNFIKQMVKDCKEYYESNS